MARSILYIGSLEASCNSYSRYNTLKGMGYNVTGIDTDRYIHQNKFEKLHIHLNVGPGIAALNKEVIKAVQENVPDVIWVDNKPFLKAGTLKKIKFIGPATTIINLITDDPTGKYRYAWRLCLENANYYDFHFVQRRINVEELKKYGAQRVEICYRSYDPKLHRPVLLDETDRAKYKTAVGFIGTYESVREEFIVYLLRNNIPVSITGNDWEKAKHWNIIKPFYRGRSLYGEPYVKTINGFDIALHFLRHVNRDEQDSRTFEIPACGAFMLAERSGLHSSLFEDNKEAVFFETKEELLQKVHYYLVHSEERRAIAKAGYDRCRSSSYSHEARLQEVLEKIAKE